MTSYSELISQNLYDFYDRISQICDLKADKQTGWSVSENIPGFWPRVIYRINPDIVSKSASVLLSDKVKSGHYPELLIAGDEGIRQIDPFLRSQGFYPFSAWKGMIISNLNDSISPDVSDVIRIIQPESSADKEQWLKIANFELLAPLLMDKTLLESLISQPDFEIYLLKYNEVGVSILLVFQTADTIGLYLIATEKSAQKLGFASILVQHYLTEKAQRLKKPVILHATQKGEKLYSRLGFRAINQFFLYQHLKTNL